jgi:hypothetical protein
VPVSNGAPKRVSAYHAPRSCVLRWVFRTDERNIIGDVFVSQARRIRQAAEGRNARKDRVGLAFSMSVLLTWR